MWSIGGPKRATCGAPFKIALGEPSEWRDRSGVDRRPAGSQRRQDVPSTHRIEPFRGR
jgi:hypothetical protein